MLHAWLILQLQEDIPELIYQGGFSPNSRNEMTSYLNERLCDYRIARRGRMPRQIAWSDTDGFLCVRLYEEQCLRSAAANTTRAQDTKSEGPV